MPRVLSLVFLGLALATAHPRACAQGFALTRLTDNTWDDQPGQVDRMLVLDLAMRPNAVFVGSTPAGQWAVYHAWRPDSWVVQPAVEDPFGLYSPTLASAPSGAVHLTYCRWTDTGTSIDHTRILEGTVDPPDPICPADPSLAIPSVAVGPDSAIHVVLCQSDSICYVRREETGWSPPERLAEGRFASLAVGPDGECHVVYQWMDAERVNSVWYVHGTRGAWSYPQHLAGADGLSARYPTIAVDLEGRVHVAYEQFVPDDRLIDYLVRSAGVWSAAEHVASGVQPALALDATGSPYVAFWTFSAFNGVAVSRRLPGPVWTTISVDPEARFGSEVPLRPGLAVDDADDVQVVYDSRDPRGGDDTEIWYATGQVTSDVPRADSPGGVELSCWPNPARRSLAIRWVLAAPGWSRVTVSDLCGRHVRTLREGTSAAGECTATWDGLDALGQRVPAGLYWCRVRTEHSEATRKVVLIGD